MSLDGCVAAALGADWRDGREAADMQGLVNDWTDQCDHHRPGEFVQNITTVSVTIAITDDIFVEGTENFQASLSLITNLPNIIVMPNQTTISIEDDDCKSDRKI